MTPDPNRPLTWAERYAAKSKGMTPKPLDPSSTSDETPQQTTPNRPLTWEERYAANSKGKTVEPLDDFQLEPRPNPAQQKEQSFWSRYLSRQFNFDRTKDLEMRDKLAVEKKALIEKEKKTPGVAQPTVAGAPIFPTEDDLDGHFHSDTPRRLQRKEN